MPAVEGARDIWRRKRNNEFPRSIGVVKRLRLEKATLLPPGIPGRLDRQWIVGLEVRGIERLDDLLLAGLGRILEGREGFNSLLRLLLLLLLLL